METGSTARVRSLGTALALVVSSLSCLNADWPGWRGPHRDGRSPEALPETLPAEPKPLWKRTIGHGYSGAITSGDTLLYVDDSQGSETAHALDRTTGKERWSTSYAKSWSDEFEPGPRCTPQIDGDRVYVQSAQGTVACLSLTDGKHLWGIDFKDLGMTWVPDRQSNIGAAVRRGHTGSPVVDGDRLFLQTSALNGRSIIAVDKRTGKQLWQALDEHTTYTSPVIATLAGRRQCVTATVQGLVGLDVDSGNVLWRTAFQTGANRNVLTPIILGDDVLFASHTTGLRCQSITASGTNLASGQRWLVRNLNLNLSTPVVVDGWGFGLGPARNFICFDTKSGKVAWDEPGFGAVANVIADAHHLLVHLDTGEVRLLKATPQAYTEVARFQASGKTYSHPAWHGGILYVRDPLSLTAWSILPKP